MHFFSIDQKIWHFFVKISQYFKDRSRLGNAERCVQRSCVICPQVDVICTYGAFHAAEPRYQPTPTLPKGKGVLILF